MTNVTDSVKVPKMKVKDGVATAERMKNPKFTNADIMAALGTLKREHAATLRAVHALENLVTAFFITLAFFIMVKR